MEIEEYKNENTYKPVCIKLETLEEFKYIYHLLKGGVDAMSNYGRMDLLRKLAHKAKEHEMLYKMNTYAKNELEMILDPDKEDSY